MKTYQLISIIDMSHLLMNHVINENSIVADMTVGNGHDMQYLATRTKHVYGFDINEQAIISTTKRLLGQENITLFHASHSEFGKYIDPRSIDLFVFNLGYLPGSDKTLTTTKETTLTTLQQLFVSMRSHANIQLVCYVGHSEGKEEYEAIRQYCETIREEAEIIHYEFLNAPKSAKIIMLNKKERTTI